LSTSFFSIPFNQINKIIFQNKSIISETIYACISIDEDNKIKFDPTNLGMNQGNKSTEKNNIYKNNDFSFFMEKEVGSEYVLFYAYLIYPNFALYDSKKAGVFSKNLSMNQLSMLFKFGQKQWSEMLKIVLNDELQKEALDYLKTVENKPIQASINKFLELLNLDNKLLGVLYRRNDKKIIRIKQK